MNAKPKKISTSRSKPKTARLVRAKAGRPALGETDKTRSSLLEAAVRLFAKKGFDGTSVKDISDMAGTNISLVSYHFGGKEGLYRACLEQFGKNRLAATERLLQPPRNREEATLRIEMFIDDMMIWFEEEPDLCAIVQRESDMGFPIAKDVFQSTFVKVFLTFVTFVRSGQKEGFLRGDFDPSIASSLFFGGLVSMIRKDEITKKTFGVSIREPAYRKKLISQISRTFFEGLQAVGVKK